MLIHQLPLIVRSFLSFQIYHRITPGTNVEFEAALADPFKQILVEETIVHVHPLPLLYLHWQEISAYTNVNAHVYVICAQRHSLK
jgi:hypothetical protein